MEDAIDKSKKQKRKNKKHRKVNISQIARIFYSMLKYGTEYVDLGQEYYEQRYQDRVIANLKGKAKQFGFEFVNIK